MTEQGKAPAARTACEVCGRPLLPDGAEVTATYCLRGVVMHEEEVCYRLGFERMRDEHNGCGYEILALERQLDALGQTTNSLVVGRCRCGAKQIGATRWVVDGHGPWCCKVSVANAPQAPPRFCCDVFAAYGRAHREGCPSPEISPIPDGKG